MSNGYYLINNRRNNSYSLNSTLTIPKIILKYTRSELIVYYKFVVNVHDREYVRIYRFKELEHIWNKLKIYLDIGYLATFNIRTCIQRTNSSFKLVKKRRLNLENQFNTLLNKHFNLVFNHFFIINESTYKKNKFHNNVRIFKTYWKLENNNIFLIELPWASQSNVSKDVCEIDTIKKESLKIIKRRYYEFYYIVNWIMNQKNIVDAKQLLIEISRYRKENI